MSGRYFPDDSYPPRGPSREYDPRGGRDYRRSSRRGSGDYDQDYDQGYADGEDDYGYRPRNSVRDVRSSRSSSRRGGRDDYGPPDDAERGYDDPRYDQRGYAPDAYVPPPTRRSQGTASSTGSRRPGSPDAPVWGQAGPPTYPDPYPDSGAAYGPYASAPYGGRGAVMAPPRTRRKSRRGLWITLGAVAALLLALGGSGAFAAVEYFAPAVAAGEFCGYVKAQGYSQAYALLSANLKGQVTAPQFSAALTALDTLDGTVSSCAAATGSNTYSASIFGSSATVGMVISRATAGALQGSLHLKKDSTGWHVDTIDSTLLGTSLGGLVAVDTYCADLKAQQYATTNPAGVYSLLGSKLQAASKEADFVQLEQWHDTVDGQVSVCQPTAVASGATESAASYTLSITRTKLAAQKGALALAVESGAWKVGSIDAPLQGTDLGALQTGARFCADLASANYADAYTLGDATWWKGRTASQVTALLAGTSGGIKWSSCTLDATTFTTKSGYSLYGMTFTLTLKSTGQSGPDTETIAVGKVSGVWKLHGIVSG